MRASLSEARFGVPVRNLLYLLLATGWLFIFLPSHFFVFNISLSFRLRHLASEILKPLRHLASEISRPLRHGHDGSLLIVFS